MATLVAALPWIIIDLLILTLILASFTFLTGDWEKLHTDQFKICTATKCYTVCLMEDEMGWARGMYAGEKNK